MSISDELKGSNIVNLGSSTSEFVATHQPYIQVNVISNLKKIGNVISVDIKNESGVDLIANFLSQDGQVLIKSKKPKLIMASNLLEHLPDPIQGLQKLIELVPTGSYLLLTGPTRYPFHPDPIDNKFRPTARKIQKLVGNEFFVSNLDSIFGGSVLTCTSENKLKAYSYLFSQLTFSNLIKRPRHFAANIRNMLYPVFAYCGLFKKL